MCRNMLPAEGLGSQGPSSKAGPCPSGRNTSSTATDPPFQLVFTVLSLSFPSSSKSTCRGFSGSWSHPCLLSANSSELLTIYLDGAQLPCDCFSQSPFLSHDGPVCSWFPRFPFSLCLKFLDHLTLQALSVSHIQMSCQRLRWVSHYPV